MKTYVPVRLVITRGELDNSLRDGSCLTKVHVLVGSEPILDGWVEIQPPRRQGMTFEVCVDDGLDPPKDKSWIQKRAAEKTEELLRQREAEARGETG